MWLARAFTAGRRLWVWAPGAPDHAHHVAVEFVHPVVAGTRPLAAAVAASAADRTVSTDATLVIGPDGATADLFISTDQSDTAIVRSYHVLWELVQVALEHPGLIGSSAVAGGDSTGFLYPFLDAAEADEAALRRSLRASADAKTRESEELSRQAVESNGAALAQAATAIGRAAGSGGRVLTMGNGGSATDAARLARLLRARGIPSESLSADYAVATALANDLGAERIFSRQLDAFAAPGDVLVGCSTSGASRNLLAAFDQASAIGLATVGLSGYGGGSFTDHPSVNHKLVVQSMSVHRIQEAQAALMSALCERVAGALAATSQTS
ncbi:MAG: SIS domain-containing protein [Acidimicrobiaceae bacterium]|nr:SIS domain-containing protein [Acidimicrobiaceae bacterium]MYF32484.1 SIS domain-containing protein [Acidimicrobiaceae bacterium]MYG77185.1 SIS domain-containing protein [Acidimicrobiaceae bacterium]MYJ86078.1 SIS domain-containing protein [Acidimicrobiaceae bacterium]